MNDNKLAPRVEKAVREAMKSTFTPSQTQKISKVDCINVFDNKWRVNCWSFGPNFRIPHSFFVTYSPDDGIISSNPPVAPQPTMNFEDKWGLLS